MPVVEIQMLDANTLSEAMASMRQWLDHRHFQPAIFRSTIEEAGLLLRIEFASAAQAVEFARAFDGTIAGAPASSPPQNGPVWLQPTLGGSSVTDAGVIDTTLAVDLEDEQQAFERAG